MRYRGEFALLIYLTRQLFERFSFNYFLSLQNEVPSHPMLTLSLSMIIAAHVVANQRALLPRYG